MYVSGKLWCLMITKYENKERAYHNTNIMWMCDVILEACISSEEYNYDRLSRMRITIEWSITVSSGQAYTIIKKCLFVVIVTYLYVHI